ncbi:MAG: hypothetical protein ACJ8LG_12785 [Massilia sp.]
MKKLAIIVSLAALAGCAAPPPGPAYYGTRAPTGDPSQWQVVSVTPVPPGTGARAAANGQAGVTTSSNLDYSAAAPSTTVVQPVYVPQPVYAPVPVYAPAPVYVDPYPSYWWPPISIGLGFSWGHWSGGHRGWGGGRGWGGHGGWSGHGGGFRHR